MLVYLVKRVIQYLPNEFTAKTAHGRRLQKSLELPSPDLAVNRLMADQSLFALGGHVSTKRPNDLCSCQVPPLS